MVDGGLGGGGEDGETWVLGVSHDLFRGPCECALDGRDRKMLGRPSIRINSVPFPIPAHTPHLMTLPPSPADIQIHLYSAFLQARTADVALHVRGSWNAIYRLHRVVLIQSVTPSSVFFPILVVLHLC